MLITGVDPGLSGAVSLIDPAGPRILEVWDIPTLMLERGGKNKREIDIQGLCNLLPWGEVSHCFLERVASMPGQGVSGVFAFGKTYGIILGVLGAMKVPMTLVSPQKWKRALEVPAEKDGARSRASELLPSAAHHWPLKKHDGRAESALIGLWGTYQLNGNPR